MSTGQYRGIFIDSNLLVLLVVGSLDKQLIARHRRLSAFTPEDFDILADLMTQVEVVFATPNTLTEASNLIAQHREPQRRDLLGELQRAIETTIEIIVPSAEASLREEFIGLGLADAALLTVVNSDRPLLTDDLQLYLAALQNDENAALYFNHFREP